jgi:hypothetical protein
VQDFRWDKGGTVRAGDYNFFYAKRKRKSSVGNTIYFIHHTVLSTVKRVEFVSDRMSCMVFERSLE